MIDPAVVLAVLLVGAPIMIAIVMLGQRESWHDRHHKTRSELMCNRCRDRFRQDPRNAPRYRVLGGRRG